MGVKSATTYDQYGNSTANVVQPSADAPLMKTETVYSDNGNYVIAQKDARGNSVVNLLDSNGRTVSVTDPAGNSVFYAYDASNRVVGVTSEASGKVHKNSYTYENDRIKTIAHNTTSDTVNDVIYTFEYDDLGRKTAVKVGNQELSRNVYSEDRKGLLDEMSFGNGAKVRYEYDDFGRTTAIYVDEPGETSTTPKYEFKYDARGIANVIKDNVLMTETRVTSDLADRPCESVMKDANGNLLHKNILNYDGKNRVKEFLDILSDTTHKTTYTYDADDRVTEVKYDNSDTHKVNLTYDLLNRVTNRTVTNGVPYSTTYGYLDGDAATYGAGATTPLISAITQGSGANAMNFAYTYDSRGNITSEVKTVGEADAVTVSYEYDELGQLIRVDDPNDTTAGTGGTTWVYTYDRGGNILNKSAYAYTTSAVSSPVNQWTYAYEDSNWKDKLTKFNGVAITYDAIGNPLSDGTWTYVWEKGRQLKSMHNAATGVMMEFKYNAEGIRTQKVKKVNGVVEETTNYILSGKKIVAMTNSDETLYFTYDSSGSPATVIYCGTPFTYVKNLQGDIVGIADANGDIIVKYQYDAWGKLIRTSGIYHTVLGKANPFRYRGYVYDEETGLYYLRSRYYNPVLGRFLNADTILGQIGKIQTNNLYNYCSNTPVSCSDANGHLPELAIDFYRSASTADGPYIAGDVLGLIGAISICAYYYTKELLKGIDASISSVKTTSPTPTPKPTATPKPNPTPVPEESIYYLAIAYGNSGPIPISPAMTKSSVFATLHVINVADVITSYVQNSNYSNKRDYVYGVYTVHKDDAYKLASRFGINPRLDLADGLRYPHFNIDNKYFKDIHFWFHH